MRVNKHLYTKIYGFHTILKIYVAFMQQWELLKLKLFHWNGFAICSKRESVSAQELAKLDSRLIRNTRKST